MGWRCLRSTVNILAFLRKGLIALLFVTVSVNRLLWKRKKKKEIAVNLFHDYGLKLAFLRLTTKILKANSIKALVI